MKDVGSGFTGYKLRKHPINPTLEIPVPYGAEFDSICICYCAYKPIENAPLKQYDRSPVSIDSFGGDRIAYDRWLESQKQTAEV